MHFGENQLSPRSLGISPLPTAHPPVLQHWWVRASTGSYPGFTLAMGSSRGFGSAARDSCALFRLAFAPAPRRRPLNLATRMHSPVHSSIGTPSAWHRCRWPRTACTSAVSGSLSLPSPGCFSPFPHGTLRYRSLQVFSLGEWSPQLPTAFHERRRTRVLHAPAPRPSPTGLSPSPAAAFQSASARHRLSRRRTAVLPTWPHNPHATSATGHLHARVWAPPRSLATTRGVVLSSSGY